MKNKATKTKSEILKELSDKAIALRDIRFGVAGSKQKNVKEASNIKREIARLKTALKNSQ
jgi:ribosomal protein L29